jgi:hypothetical protein
MRAGAADRAGVGGDGAEFKAEAREDARVRVVHVPIFALQVLEAGVEGVAVLHHELAPAHDAEARAAFVAELGLDLVEVHRQLAIALEFRARQIGDDLLGSRLHHEVALVPVLEAQQLRAVGAPAARFLPQLGRLHDRHRQLHRAGAVHLFPHDGLDLALHTQPGGQPRVHAGGEPANQPGAQHQPMADDLRFRGDFLQRRDRKVRGAHRWGKAAPQRIEFAARLWKNRTGF